MSTLDMDCALLTEFEKELDPRHLENGAVPARVIGYGEISTVLEIGTVGTSELAYKRVPIFRNEHEVNCYESLYREYIQTLCDPIGIQVVPSDMARIIDERNNRVVVYIVQEKLAVDSIAHKAIHHLQPQDINRLVLAILTELFKLFDFNQHNKGTLELGIDGQISNWAIVHFDPASAVLDERINLLYIDTSTPLMRKDGREQVDTEPFLRSAPSFLVWLLRWFFIEDLKTRYYDFRKVTIDLIANFYKEQRPELIPGLLETVNGFFSARIHDGEFKPITIEEIQAYYREDVWIWKLYLAFRKVDRFLHNLAGKYYPYILPDTIKR